MDAVQMKQMEAACRQACAAIAPAWPLDRSIAVNPHWCRVGMPIREVAARMAVLGGIQVFPSRASLLQAWQSGRITKDDIEYAIAALPAARAAGLTAEQCLAAIHKNWVPPRLPLLIDTLDTDPMRHTRLSWREAITHQVSQSCAAYFDEHQSDWAIPKRDGLYAFWRDTLQHDHGVGLLMGIPDLRRHLKELPPTFRDAERWALEQLDLPSNVWPEYLEAVLLTVNGWASWCAYLAWQAQQNGKEDTNLRELLAIRLGWGAVLQKCHDDYSTKSAISELRNAWRLSSSTFAQAQYALLIDEVWQYALEVSYQRQLERRLCVFHAAPAAAEIEVQAAFCIDVRSEPLRRALETAWPAVQTVGFAGFFGIPMAYTPLGTDARRPQLPGLLPPSMEVTDHVYLDKGHDGSSADSAATRARHTRLGVTAQWKQSTRWPSASFSFVEIAGIGYAGALWRWVRPSTGRRERTDLAGLPSRYKKVCRPVLQSQSPRAKADLAGRVLRAMGLANNLAPLVVLVGHGSQSYNNAHSAALDCGACCGQSGEVNARTLALLLNDPNVRTELQSLGIDIPARVQFVAALHNTTTDQLEAFDLDLLPESALARWSRFENAAKHACDQVRRERAPKLGIDARLPNDQLLKTFLRRANDGAQTRPEWGLAGNAAFVIAPRHRTRGICLDGRVFLHDYEHSKDPDGSLLEQLLTAPMLVTHWINWQYHASTCDPEHLGSGNKLLHNVVGSSIGVFEGNGGDLRIGLARQSLHDGERWIHEPLRLTVLIDAPGEAIERVIEKHEIVRHLVSNGWLHLWRFGHDGLQRWFDRQWGPLGLGPV
ncbi:YbcC family protein [Ralstonia pickettii]|nr:DUF2309 domain-containing protein [Ralstonia pickettii]